jgi:predicted AAA+ superfamily ATPase
MFRPRLIPGIIDICLSTPEAVIISGMRGTGKTSLLNHLYNRLNKKNRIFIDLENPLNRKYFEENNYERIKTSIELLGIDFSRKPYIFLDEIQFVKNLPSVARYFIQQYDAKFFLTSSARFSLKSILSESLPEKNHVIELYPLSFREFLRFKDNSIKIPEKSNGITPELFDTLSHLYDEYVRYGGFPGVVLKTSLGAKKKALEEIFSSFFHLEIFQLGDFRRNKEIRDLMLLLMKRAGSPLDIQKISRELGISRPSLYEYISFLERTYFIKTIRPLSRKRNSEIRKTPKAYICDTGLAHHLAQLDMDSLFENSIFQNLIRRGRLHYYRRKSGTEIDFILNQKEGYRIKYNPLKSDTTKLEEMAEGLNLKEFKTISRSYIESENILYGFML